MAYTDIDKPSDYFNTKLYTGDDTSPRTITGVNFQPDFTWIKRRDNSGANHILFDSVRGAGSNKELLSNSTTSEGGGLASAYGYLSAFASDGFTLTDGTDPTNEDLYTNQSGATFVSWNWLAGGTAVSNTDGNTATNISVNQTAGFSIVSYTVSSETTMSLGHGLNAVPKMIITKSLGVSNWDTYHVSTGNTGRMQLNKTDAFDVQANVWSNTTPTSSVFYQAGNGGWFPTGTEMIAYCFAEKKGFSKFGKYTGNGSTDGTFVYTGFKPAFIIAKKTDTTSGWGIFDNKRTPYNVMNNRLLANTSGVDDISSDNNVDFVSNGIKFRSSAGWNASASYIYMAFAEQPFVTSTGIPATAR